MTPVSSRKPPSAGVLERERRQNGRSQLASRERNKKIMEDLRLELLDCVKYNESMYVAIQDVLEQTKSLKTAIEGVLTCRPPRVNRECKKSVECRAPR
jgi:hypothetical protein